MPPPPSAPDALWKALCQTLRESLGTPDEPGCLAFAEALDALGGNAYGTPPDEFRAVLRALRQSHDEEMRHYPHLRPGYVREEPDPAADERNADRYSPRYDRFPRS